jgi:hypothetical protein
MVTGKLTHRDYETFAPLVDEMVTKHGKVRFLLEMADFHGWELGAVWDDMKLGIRHFSDISRIAMVGDKSWEKGMSVFCKPFTRAEIRYFAKTEKEEALRWINAPATETAKPVSSP